MGRWQKSCLYLTIKWPSCRRDQRETRLFRPIRTAADFKLSVTSNDLGL